VTGSDAESDLQHRVAGRLTGLGFDVDAWQLDLASLADHPAHPGTEATRTEGYGVVGSFGPAGIPALVLQGHVDVVPTGDLDKWQDRDPWSGRVRGGTVHGRGACDMKAGVAVNLAVARALAVAGVVLERPFAVHSVISEEDGGLGAFATLLRGHDGEAAVITEPTSGKVVVANAGALTFRLRVAGRAAHGSARLSGHSALDAFLPVYAALAELERERNARPDALFDDNPLPYPISVGKVRAGDWASSVPDLLVAEGRLGVALGEPVEAARAELEQVVADVCAADPWLSENPVKVEWYGGQFASSVLDEDHPLVALVSGAHRRITGRNPAVHGAPWGSDIRLLSGLGGVPAVHYGPGDVRKAHGPDESVPVNELVPVTRSLVMLLARACGAS
jgi:acetylornithine deacetylase